MAVKSGDTGDGRYARSRDKWRRILRESERDAEAMQQAVVALEAEQVGPLLLPTAAAWGFLRISRS